MKLSTMKAIFYSTYTAIPTPFNEKYEIDWASLKNILEYQSGKNISGIVVSGSTGEKMSLTDQEYLEVLKFCKENFKNKTLIAGISDTSITKVLQNLKIANDLKYDKVLLTNPCYVKAQEVGILEYFKIINDNTKIPIMLYNVPSRTGQNMNNKLIAKLCELHMVDSIKDATGDLTRPADLISLLNKDIQILSGEDATIPAFNAQGGSGVVSVVSNIYPDFVHDIQNNNPSKDDITKLNNVANAMFCESNPVPVKYALFKLGIIQSPNVRLPLSALQDNSRTSIESIL